MSPEVLAFREAAKQALAQGVPSSDLIRMVQDLDAPDSFGERLSGQEQS